MSTGFIPLARRELKQLRKALIANLEREKTILIDDADTGFVRVVHRDDVPDEEVIRAIRSTPTHF